MINSAKAWCLFERDKPNALIAGHSREKVKRAAEVFYKQGWSILKSSYGMSVRAVWVIERRPDDQRSVEQWVGDRITDFLKGNESSKTPPPPPPWPEPRYLKEGIGYVDKNGKRIK